MTALPEQVNDGCSSNCADARRDAAFQLPTARVAYVADALNATSESFDCAYQSLQTKPKPGVLPGSQFRSSRSFPSSTIDKIEPCADGH